jgi:GNAT superfamily N-acetyltransferase
MRIRRFQEEDARRVSYLVCKALRETNSRDYPPQTIEAVARSFSPSNVILMSRKRPMYVVADGPRILGTGSLSQNWILSFFVNPRYHGQGIGTHLLDYLERRARKAGHDVTSVPSGFTAIGFYRKRGYRKSRDQSKASKDWVILSKKMN